MNNVNKKGLMLGMLAIGGLIAGGAMFTTGQAYATPFTDPNGDLSVSNTAAAANSDDDSVTQSNSATVYQDAEVKCKASVDDNDGVQEGSNTNTAANACSSEQSSTVGQANVNEDNDVQDASALACQTLAGLGINFCGNTITEEEEEPEPI
jgi:hypothetical protein